MRRWAEVLLVLCSVTIVTAQEVGVNWHPSDGAAYLSEELPEVHVTCDQMDWILQQENWYSNIEHPATELVLSRKCCDVGKVMHVLRCSGDRLSHIAHVT